MTTQDAPLDAIRAHASLRGIDNSIDIVRQSLETVRAEDDGESRTIRASIAAREHVIELLTGYRERVAAALAPSLDTPAEPTCGQATKNGPCSRAATVRGHDEVLRCSQHDRMTRGLSGRYPRHDDSPPPPRDPAAPEWDEADGMCPNCLTPWKCNGPHLSEETVAGKRNAALAPSLDTPALKPDGWHTYHICGGLLREVTKVSRGTEQHAFCPSCGEWYQAITTPLRHLEQEAGG